MRSVLYSIESELVREEIPIYGLSGTRRNMQNSKKVIGYISSQPVKKVKINFSDGTSIAYFKNCWCLENDREVTFDELLKSIPEPVRNTILFNLDIFTNL